MVMRFVLSFVPYVVLAILAILETTYGRIEHSSELLQKPSTAPYSIFMKTFDVHEKELLHRSNQRQR